MYLVTVEESIQYFYSSSIEILALLEYFHFNLFHTSTPYHIYFNYSVLCNFTVKIQNVIN